MSEPVVKYEGRVDQCPICSEQPINASPVGKTDTIQIICPRCGEYEITHQAQVNLKTTQMTQRQRANMSSWLYENQRYRITTENLDALTILKAPSFHDRADRLLLAIEKDTEFAGQYIGKKKYWISCTWCSNEEELKETLEYLQSTQRLLPQRVISGRGAEFKITPEGWARLEQLRKINADSEQCFVAMWFDDSMNPIYDDVIAKAVRGAGYRPHRVDKREHNEKIDDEIIAQIRRSRFIVADFTGHRGGVYYEAGFAKGLGLEVIWACRKDEIEKLHFDIRQYNCIDWEADKLSDFMKRLTNRIESVLGRGTYKDS